MVNLVGYSQFNVQLFCHFVMITGRRMGTFHNLKESSNYVLMLAIETEYCRQLQLELLQLSQCIKFVSTYLIFLTCTKMFYIENLTALSDVKATEYRH